MPDLLDLLDLKMAEVDVTPPVCIVRLKTTYWSDRRGLHIQKSITFMKRLSHGFNLLEEDLSQLGAEDVAVRILDLHTHPDGLYQVVVYNESRDWESGNVEDYDYKLVQYLPIS